MNFRIQILLLLASLSFAAGLAAEVRLPRLVSSHMVLQRDIPNTLWGWADPQEQIRIQFKQLELTTIADKQGNWKVALPAQSPGGPHSITITGKNRLVMDDILFGDVWLASGQSNMELTLARTEPKFTDLIPQIHNTEIRYFDVPDRYDFKTPQVDLAGGNWVAATQENIRNLSAVGYFFADSIYRTHGIPIGIINASLGGSPVEAWLSENTLKKFPDAYQEAQRFRNDALIQEITQADENRSKAWFAELNQKDAGMQSTKPKWSENDFDDSQWPLFPVPGYWPEAYNKPVNGVFWFRKDIHIPAKFVKQNALLILGALVDTDQVYVNGTQVGTTGYMYPPRRYPVPQGLLKVGKNTITVRLTSLQGRGGFVLDKEYALKFSKKSLNLAGNWRYKMGAEMPPLEPPTFVRWQPLGLYNGMIAPLLQTKFTGIIWYQGESNTKAPQLYRERFTAMIDDWRKQFAQGNLPFLFVQLANFLPPGSKPTDNNWAELREAQSQSLTMPNTAMAVAIDVGEWNDIHPLDKKTIGQRLALAAENLAYANKIPFRGPVYQSMEFKNNKVLLHFDYAEGGLVAKNGNLKGFTLAGEDNEFYPAIAKIKNRNSVEVFSKKVKCPKQLRYAWANNPEGVNLYNNAGLPASPFQVSILTTQDSAKNQ
jgi:sialate O-acetylesterase